MAEILKGENRYVLAKNDDAWHIFPASHNVPPTSGCKILNGNKSICRNLDWSDANHKGTCYREQTMREKCATIGRPVCGTCISHLYKEVSEEEQKILNS